MGLIYGVAGPSCFVSPDVQVLPSREHDIPYIGTCVAVVVPVSGNRDYDHYMGIIFDSVTTLYVDELNSSAELEAFSALCASNRVPVHRLAGPGGGTSCPPPPNQLDVERWCQDLFQQYRPRD